MEISPCKLFVVVLFNLLGVGLLMVSQNTSTIVRSLAAGKVVLSEGSEAARTFAEPPVPTHIKFYFFDLSNIDDFLKQGKKPILQEKGPYVFRISSSKTMTWNDSKITYEPKKSYVFVESESEGNRLSDTITTVNPGAMTALMFGAEGIKNTFNTATVGEFLFEGVEADDGEKYGYYYNKNGSIEGTFEASTGGGGHIEDLNQIITVDGESDLMCEKVRGTNGERFAPFSVPPPTLTFYSPSLCRPWNLHYAEVVTVNDLKCVRYSSGRDFFSPTFDEKLDRCLAEDLPAEDVNIRGVFNAAKYLGSPILLSLPHYLNADPKLGAPITGLSPSDKKHNFYMDVYPELGFVLDMRIRVQVNFRLKKTLLSSPMEIIYPIFWQEMMLLDEDSKEAASIVYKKVKFSETAMYWTTLVLGALLILAAEIFLLSGICSKDSSDDYGAADDAYVTYSSRNDRSRVNLR